MAEEEKTGDSVPEGSEADSQEVLGDAILGKEETPTEEPKGETEKPKEGDQPKKVEEEAEKPEEKAEVKAPDEIEAQTQKLFDKHKGDPKGLAKALANQYALDARQTGELGDLRKRSLEYDSLVKRIHDDPDGVKGDIDTLHRKEEEGSSLLDRALSDDTVLPKYIESAVTEQLGRVEREHQVEEDLAKIYPDYKQVKPQMEEIAKQIAADRFTPQECRYLMVKGYWAKEALDDAKNLARVEDRDALAKKAAGQTDKQGVMASEKEIDLTDENVKQEVLGNAILKARR